MEYLKPYIDAGLISVRKHPTHDLWVANYTALAQYERRWDEVTLNHRGRVIDSNGNTISPCIPKFFNYEEHVELEALEDIDYEEDFWAYEKLDGSYIAITNHPDYDELIVSSRGSFESDHVAWAEEIIAGKNYQVPEGYTYICELIHPENRIVVDYGRVRNLVLLTRFHNGIEIPLHEISEDDEFAKKFPWAQRVTVDEFMDLDMNQANFEGYVIHFTSGLRVKFKLEEYVRIHKVVTNLSHKKVFEAVRDNTIHEVIEVLPDEHFDWVKKFASSVEFIYDSIVYHASKIAERVSTLDTRKEQADVLLNTEKFTPYAHVVFSMLDGRDYSKKVWDITWSRLMELGYYSENTIEVG